MTYKSAVAGINLGGGKSVIVGDNRRPDREALFRAHGRFVETLGGRYITAEDIGTSPADMEYIKLETDHVAGLLGLSRRSVAGHGVRRVRGNEGLGQGTLGQRQPDGKTVAVQGCGNVATHLCRYLHEEGVKLVVTDIDQAKVARVVTETGAMAVAPDAIYDMRGGHLRAHARSGPRSTTIRSTDSRSRSSRAAPTTSWPRIATAICSSSGGCSTRRTT